MKIKVGIGYDVHQLVSGRKLILGGVDIPHELGLLGHSDADVLTHAIMDALLGAAGLGDIGRHFPDTDPAYRGISSLVLLEHVMTLIRSLGYEVGNVDAVIAAQRPKLLPHMTDMKAKLGPLLGLEESDLNLKATTTERLGFEGREEGISVTAVCLLEKSS
ncbi:2-C-methyl-D-erythritol 2,4-cyclodiphosphate synthase [Acidaminobacter hydrogenoformans DSM 2784]|uniref:2-C-methyl-D-erythritol 2,4-cyclodiphosphate synthase n=1 Tax=Acidaminobacter hydrogenoformans DSM 2784 TaxID=1120920 RepID=A0A1G5S6I8_9FIRM|nr:2-C-methyl-D-erythritol 2,4-cyclodiphosphate synthase [Acidaminobacter hydrogenoformans]SCZ81974.1 2-C-methyl-D-erythritol 2,4-cyclodiphosphate synthase [Acidaminobacter hydrogenoformans DSM 2784]